MDFTQIAPVDLGLIIAIVGSAVGIVAVVVMLMLWVRGEANADRRDIVQLVIGIKDEISAIREESRSQISAIQLEMKDFHNRLCAIEERRK